MIENQDLQLASARLLGTAMVCSFVLLGLVINQTAQRITADAIIVCDVTASPARAQPRNTATTGLT